MIYLDYNATTPCDNEVVQAMLPYFTKKFGNAASRTHSYGWIAEEGVEQARAEVARLIHAEKQEIIFTSGATESCNLAIKGIFELYDRSGTTGKKHIITCLTEHKAVLDTCGHLERSGADITYIKVDDGGRINLEELKASIRPETILIALMYANNETGVIQPVAEIAEIAKQRKVIFFCDASQAVGKIAVDVRKDGIDILALSAHKFYGPKGVGALYLRRRDPRVRLVAQMDGGGHERGFRSGTLNVPAIVGMGKAAGLCSGEYIAGEIRRIGDLRDRLESALLKVEGSEVNGSILHRLPNVCNIAFKGIKAERLIAVLNVAIAFSVGSACTSVSKEPSHVLKAMRKEQRIIDGSIRLSLGRFTTISEIDMVIKDITRAVNVLKSENEINV